MTDQILSTPEAKGKRAYVSQSDFPRLSLAKALSMAKTLWESFAGRGGAPHDVAIGLNMSPTSGSWRNLCGASIAYGLTDGGCNAKEIVLTDLGRRCVAPETEGDDRLAKAEAVMQPRIMRAFFEKYGRAKFPQRNIAENVLASLGLPRERTKAAVPIIEENGTFTGILRETKTGLFVALDLPAGGPPSAEREAAGTPIELSAEEIAAKVSGGPRAPSSSAAAESSNRVFISHGKNKKIVDQLKELLTFGKLVPVVSVEKETTSIPVPDKVLQDMRSCYAAVIHVSQEGELLDSEGNAHVQLNENVLVEIGAAIALYGKNFVLLVEEDISLPSDLQGLYRCDYEGDSLDHAATMKLLKTFNQFK